MSGINFLVGTKTQEMGTGHDALQLVILAIWQKALTYQHGIRLPSRRTDVHCMHLTWKYPLTLPQQADLLFSHLLFVWVACRNSMYSGQRLETS